MTLGEIQAVLWAKRRQTQEREDEQAKKRMYRMLRKIKDGKR